MEKKWFAVILRPHSNIPLGEATEATQEEGMDVLLERAKARIDAEELRLSHSRASE
jgi:hypothetical protein